LETKFQIAILAETHDEMDGLVEVTSIEWLRLKQTGDHAFDFYKDNNIISSVNLETGFFALPQLLGIVVAGSLDVFDAIKNEWTSRLPSLGVAFRRVAEWDSKAILREAVDCITDDLTHQRRHSGRASLELATYRREFDRLQRCFARLEEYVGRQSFPVATEIFAYPPDSETGTKKNRQVQLDGDAAATRSLAQYLPVDSFGFSSFSIYISGKPETADKPLFAKLKAIETGAVFGEWSIDSADIKPGWVELALNQAIDGAALSLIVEIEYPPEKSGWALALGPPHPYKEFCASTGDGGYLRAPIALRVFRSLPGVRVAATTSAIRPIKGPHIRAEFVPYEAYGMVVQVFPSARDNKPTLVFFDKDIGCLTVHPRTGGLTVARLTVSVPENAWGISAQICLAHEQASPTDFGLMVCPARDEKKGLNGLNQLDTPSQSFSGWRTLLPLETKSVSVVFGASPEEELAIYLMTRQAPETSPDFAWARFSKLGFQVLPISLNGESGTDALRQVAAGGAHIDEELVNKSTAE
jgi:hypothetical protein